MKKTIWLSALIALADQGIKMLVRTSERGETLLRLPGLLEITHDVNTGAAFSMLSGYTPLLAALSAALLLGIMLFIHRAMHLTAPARIALACLLGGGIGNLIDRILYGAVTDYIRILPFRFPIFNLADIAITVSVGALVVLLLMDKLEENTGEEHGSNHSSDG